MIQYTVAVKDLRLVLEGDNKLGKYAINASSHVTGLVMRDNVIYGFNPTDDNYVITFGYDGVTSYKTKEYSPLLAVSQRPMFAVGAESADGYPFLSSVGYTLLGLQGKQVVFCVAHSGQGASEAYIHLKTICTEVYVLSNLHSSYKASIQITFDTAVVTDEDTPVDNKTYRIVIDGYTRKHNAMSTRMWLRQQGLLAEVEECSDGEVSS